VRAGGPVQILKKVVTVVTVVTAATAVDTDTLMTRLVSEARATFDSLAIHSLPSLGVASAMRELRHLRSVVDAADAALRSRARVLQPPPPPPGSRPQPHDRAPIDLDADVSSRGLEELSGLTTREGNERERHSKVLEHLPTFAPALSAGRIATSHIKVLARMSHTIHPDLWTALPAVESEMLGAALSMGPVRFSRYMTQLLVRLAAEAGVDPQRDLAGLITASTWIDPDTGLGRLVATLDPTTQAHIAELLGRRAAALRHHNRDLTRDQSTGQALVALLTQEQSGRAAPPSVSILIDHDTLVNGRHPTTICEHANGSLIPVDVAREIACTATLTPILRDRWGVVLDLGHERRSSSAAQRRAIEAMYATCFLTNCDTAVTDCHIHHLVHWEDGGPTDLDNLIPVCQQHHRLIHSTQAHLSIDAHRTITMMTALGEVSTHTPDRQPHRRQRREPSPDGEDAQI
jgi:hypothetical protein